MHRRELIVSTALAFTLAACNSTTTPPPDTPDFPVSGEILNVGDTPLPNTISLVAVHPDAYSTPPTPVSALATAYGDLLGIATSAVAEDGSFEWDLGDGSDIPAAFFAPATQAVLVPGFTTDVTCSSTASAPVSVLRSYVFPGALFVPVGIVGPLSHNGNFAVGAAVYTDAPSLDPAPTEPFRLKTWIYAKGDVSITGSCVFDNGTDPVEEVVTIDLDLEEGWNEITSLVDADAGTSAITNDPFTGAWLFFPGAI